MESRINPRVLAQAVGTGSSDGKGESLFVEEKLRVLFLTCYVRDMVRYSR